MTKPMDDLFPKEQPRRFPLEQVDPIADDLEAKLAPYCEKVMIAGSIRRRKATVHDIDIVAIPNEPGLPTLEDFLMKYPVAPSGGPKIYKFTWQRIPVDLYVATIETWATLVLIRTGPKEHNIMLCQRAKSKGMRLHADGGGLTLERFPDQQMACNTENDIFKWLGIPYRKPWEREAIK